MNIVLLIHKRTLTLILTLVSLVASMNNGLIKFKTHVYRLAHKITKNKFHKTRNSNTVKSVHNILKRIQKLIYLHAMFLVTKTYTLILLLKLVKLTALPIIQKKLLKYHVTAIHVL